MAASKPSASPNEVVTGLIAQWRLKEALNALEPQVLAKDPTDQTALQLRVRVLILLGDLEAAREAAQLLAQTYPLDPIAWERQLALGMKPEAPSREFAWQHVRAPRRTPKAFGLAAAYLSTRNCSTIASSSALLGIEAIGRDAKSGATTVMELAFRNWMARALEGLGQYDRAIEMYSVRLAHPRTTVDAATGLARCWLELGQPSRSEANAEDHERSSEDSLPFSGLALDVLQAQGKIGESYRLYRTRPASVALARLFDQPPATELDLRSGAFGLPSFLPREDPATKYG